MRLFLMAWVCICLCQQKLIAQGSPDPLAQLPAGYVSAVHKQVAGVDTKISRENKKVLRKWAKQEKRLLRKIARMDSTAAAALTAELNKRSAALDKELGNPSLSTRQYLPALDTLKTSLEFLAGQPAQLAGRVPGAGAMLNKTSMDGITRNLGQAELIQDFLQQKKELLRGKLDGLELLSKLKPLHKTAYYYKAQVDEYKSLLKDHKKLVRRGLAMLQRAKPFQAFIRRNSQLASLFRLPADPNDPSQAASLAGLQTRAQVNGLIQQQVGAAGAAQIRSSISQAQTELNALKDKVLKLGGGDSDIAMPDGFKPNPYKTKSFLKRIELGANIQSQRARGWLPTRSDIGLSAGYRVNPGIMVGLGGSYRIGWGENIRHMKITHQGISLRSFIDVKVKGSFWLTGGYERNQVQIANVDNNNTNSWHWQPSGLIGVSKVVSLNNKFLKKTKMQLLWDFLQTKNKSTPGSPILFRIAYTR